MEIIEAIKTRRSIRRYQPEPVPKQVLAEVIEISKWAASGMNTQPWEFAILGGEEMKEFKDRLAKNIADKVPDQSEFPPAPPMLPAYAERAAEYRTTTDAYQFPPGTENVDEKRKLYTYNAGRVHDAPDAIIILSEKSMLNWSSGLMSIGIMAQTICLAALAKGLGTCIMGRPVAWPNLVRELLDIPQSKAVLLSIAVGYPDTEARINNYPRTRLPLNSLVKWYGF